MDEFQELKMLLSLSLSPSQQGWNSDILSPKKDDKWLSIYPIPMDDDFPKKSAQRARMSCWHAESFHCALSSKHQPINMCNESS